MSHAKVKTETIDDYDEESLQISSTDVTSRMQRIEAIERALKFVMNEVLKLKEEQIENVHQPRKYSNKKRKFVLSHKMTNKWFTISKTLFLYNSNLAFDL